MVRDIVTDDEILSQTCTPATAEDADLAQDVVDTLLANDTAACLAANQIGETKAIGVYLNSNDKPVVLYNPQIIQKLKPFNTLEECLSQEGPHPVTRYKWIRVSYDELVDGQLVPRKKKFEGWTAQIIQHLDDHMNGVLI